METRSKRPGAFLTDDEKARVAAAIEMYQQLHRYDDAIAAYQRDQGMPANGALDPVTQSRLSVFTR